MISNDRKPAIITTIVPFLTVANGMQALEFYTAGFGATVAVRYSRPDGGITAKVMIGNAEVWIGDEEPAFDNRSPATIGGNPVRLILTISDPDTLFSRALAAGATQICPVTTEESWKIGKLMDPFGHIWEIGHPLDQDA